MVKKSQIRSTNKIKRREMNIDEVTVKSGKIIDLILNLQQYQSTEFFLAYSSIQNEVDLSNLIEKAIIDNKKVFLPRVHGEDIKFYKINTVEEYRALSKGSFDISEPDIKENNLFDNIYDIEAKGIIFVPGIAFTKKGQRIGFGKGFYDRFLSGYKSLYKIGICYDWQICEDFQSDIYDINMDMIITEKGGFNR